MSDRPPPASAGADEPPEPGREQVVELKVPGFRGAVVVVPPGAGPRPVLVAAHGAGGRAEWLCEWWRPRLGRHGFVLCPRGRAMTNAPGADSGFYFENHHRLEAEVMATLAAFRQAFGARVDPGPVVYMGYSQGAIMGALFAQKHAGTFTRLALVEGGFAEWDVPTATRFRASGGERVLLACGQSHCARGAEKALVWLERAGVPARLEHARGGGHTYGGSVGERVAMALSWLLEGDPRWADLAATRPGLAYTQTTGTPSCAPTNTGCSVP